MNGMKCGKKGAQKLILEFVGSFRGEFFFFFDWLIGEKKFGEVGWKSWEEWYTSCGIWMKVECLKKLL